MRALLARAWNAADDIVWKYSDGHLETAFAIPVKVREMKER